MIVRKGAGGALLEAAPVPHNGCRTFQGRFGPDALLFVSSCGRARRASTALLVPADG